MIEKITIKKNWGNARFKLTLFPGDGYSIETDIDEFIKRLSQVGSDLTPRNLSWTVRMKSMKGIIESIIKEAADKTISEMKQEAVKIV